MTINVNETSINSAVEGVDAGGITHLFEAKKIVSKVKDAVANLQGAEARGRKAMAKMVAALVEMGAAYIGDAKTTAALDIMCKRHGLEPVKLTGEEDANKPAPNIFLPLVRMIDGHWELVLKNGKPVVLDDGENKRKWYPNRSYEKYASVIRFFLHNGYSHEHVADLLLGEAELVLLDGKTIKPTVSEIVKADTAQQNPHGRERTVWTTEAKTKAAALKPIVTIPYTEAMKAAFTLSEDNYGSGIFRLGPNGLEILGDTGLAHNELLGLVKRRTIEMSTAYNKAMAASKVSTDV
ncbi:hypothetical protein [Agrobacterium tumefaciens]|uniref:hypothetical protein n=1 Tax=Agrobacterium tumefaciens TaxID=358 RepID=UPI0021D39CEF|nr:hypothetical protein [Agrobacterium tumefaciens]UXS04512.1 hypothetical protein FY156_23920 [Agrobacterium tumefaciens]